MSGFKRPSDGLSSEGAIALQTPFKRHSDGFTRPPRTPLRVRAREGTCARRALAALKA
jgi:hypothetical protein